jgi:Gram-negative bacterial TonB protein C-terminal
MSCKHVVAIVLLAIAACAQTGNSDAPTSVRHFVAPAYPVTAWLARIQGTAVAEVAINADGAVDSVKVISAHPMFREPLETALKQWLFQTSAATTLRVTTRFQLDADCPLTGSQEPNKRYYVQTQVSADLPANIDVKTCLPIITIDTSKSHHR